MKSLRSLFLSLLVALGPVSQSFGADQPDDLGAQTEPVGESAAWPREFSANNQEYTIYQPQVESWKNNKIEERAAVSVQTPGSKTPVFGVVWIKARTEVDRATGLVTLEDMEFSKASFPTAEDQKAAFLTAIKSNSDSLRSISLERLKASLAISQAEDKNPKPQFDNAPPKIIYSAQPALLVQIDHQPVLRDAGVPGVLRVVNSHALILLDSESGTYYVSAGNHWFSGELPARKPWHEASDIAPQTKTNLEKAKSIAADEKQVDLLQDAFKGNAIPIVYVSSEPTELVQTKGSPQFQPVSSTQLLYVKNSPGDIFLNTSDQDYYVLLSGRWYFSKTLEGPWTYVSAKSLPADFAKIPENHPKGEVLASVAGTQEAKEAVIDNQIPQTATIDREKARENVTYDGAPQFDPIRGTPLKYARNSPDPVIEVNPSSFYSVQNGVWFTSSSPNGPWYAATQVPSVIYSIPPSSPLYYVTYVYVYGSSPRYVYDGYLPGYLGTYVSADGVVVFGTGYYYQPWIGAFWFGFPITFGFGGFWGYPFYRPWWGPYHYGWAHGWGPGWGGGWRGGFGHGFGPMNRIGSANVYRNWRSPGVVRNFSSEHPIRTSQAMPNRGGPAGGRENNVFASRDGSVYRHSPQGWEKLGGARSGGGAPQSLEQDREARERGEQRTQAFNSGGHSSGRGGGRRNLFGGGGHGGR